MTALARLKRVVSCRSRSGGIAEVYSRSGLQTVHIFATQTSDPARPGFDRIDW
jgi:hypothetical protein